MIPVVSQTNALPLVRDLTFSMAVRYDDYSDFGSTTNPKYGLSWEPWSGVRFRASYGTSFRAPSFDQISQQISNRFMFALPGFTQPDGQDRPTLLLLSSPTLVPEKSRNINVGVEFNSPTLPLMVSVDYYRIVYDDRLVNPPFDTSALLHPEIYGPVIGQFSSGEATAFINEQVARGYEFFDLAGEGTDGIQYSYIRGLVNASRVRQNGFDLASRYVIEFGGSELGLQAQATFIDEIRTAFCASCTSTNILDIYGEPLRRRLRAGVSWERGGHQLNLAVNYLNHYRDTTVQPTARIGSWTTMDLNYRYELEFLSGTTFAISAINLLNREPPRTTGVGAIDGIRYDSANADPLGRTISLQIRKVWGEK
jgi:outer membrane receptor protein involved in Fe transport